VAYFAKSMMFSAGLVAAVLLSGTAPALAAEQGESDEGEFVFADNCEICHSANQGGPHKVGPNLFGVVGRVSGMAAGYTYSPAMKAASITWGANTLRQYLEGPAAMVPGTKMGFPGFRNPEDEANLIAYLATLK